MIGVPSTRWGESPVGFVVLDRPAGLDALLTRVNARLGRTQRIADLVAVPQLPRSSIGKVLKRDLADGYAGSVD